MEIIGKKAFEYLKNELSILNSQVIEIRMISTLENFDIILFLKTEDIFIDIYFENISEFSFYHNSTYVFYNVEDYKLLYLEDTKEYYLSLDPDGNPNKICETDSDFITSKGIKVEIKR